MGRKRIKRPALTPEVRDRIQAEFWRMNMERRFVMYSDEHDKIIVMRHHPLQADTVLISSDKPSKILESYVQNSIRFSETSDWIMVGEL